MRQVFRLMDMPDKIIAFDELPQDLLEGLEMKDCRKLPREWREFIGLREKTVPLLPQLDPVTRQMVTYPPIKESGYFAYVIDKELNHDKEAWSKIESYVRQNVAKDFRLMDKLADMEDGRKIYMAKPCAADVHGEWTLEVEDCVVIPLPKPETAVVPEAKPVPAAAKEKKADVSITFDVYKCGVCDRQFDKARALAMHTIMKHKNKTPVPV